MFQPKVIIIREDLFTLASKDHLEALLLHRLLQKDFSDWQLYSFDQFHKDMMLFGVKSSKISKALMRLVDKGYLLKQHALQVHRQMNSYKVQYHVVNRDLERLGYPAYEEYHSHVYFG